MTDPPLSILPRHAYSPRLLWTLWLLAGVILLLPIGVGPVARTQEARVLVTAREMVRQPFHRWMVPLTNGQVRLRKPPLAYWLSAGVFSVTGRSSEALGRLPAAAAGWGTVGLTFWIARRLFNDRAAVFAAATLFSSRLFFKFTLLAETDTLAMVFVTGGAAAIFSLPGALRAGRGMAWRQHALAACMAGAVMSKGPPAGYLAILLCLTAWVVRDRRLVTTFFTTGAIATAAALAIPWFAYVWHDPDAYQLAADAKNSADGGDHANWFYDYGPMLAQAALPWTGVWLAGLLASGGVLWRAFRSKSLAANRGLLLLCAWAGAILVPLCCWGNKQPHYLMPLMPAVFCLVGWVVDRWLSGAGPLSTSDLYAAPSPRPTPPEGGEGAGAFVGFLLALLPACCVVIAAALVPVARHARGAGLPLDWYEAGGLLVVAALSVFAWRRWRSVGLAWGGVMSATYLCSMVLAVWTASLKPVNDRSMGRDLRQAFPGATWVFRDELHLPLVYSLDAVVPVIPDADIVPTPRTVVLDETSSKRPTAGPVGWVQVLRFDDGETTCRAFVTPGSPWVREMRVVR